MAFAADDQMVVQDDAHHSGCLRHFTRHLDIGTRRRGIAGRMVVHQNHNRFRQQWREMQDSHESRGKMRAQG